MPAIMVLRSIDNPVPDGPGKWLSGEIVVITEDDHVFGFREIPVNSQGLHTVAEVNAIPVGALPIYAGVKLTDSGTITTGSTDVEVVTDDVIVWQRNGNWTNFGDRNGVPSNFYHIEITDKEPSEVNEFLEEYNKKLSYSSEQYRSMDDMRRFTTTNIRVSASGNNGFTAQGISDAISTWNTNHPSNTVVLFDTDNLTYFQCDGIMPLSLFDEWQVNTQEEALQDYYARRRWYIIQAGLDNLAANDGVIAGTSAQVAPFLRDGLLD